MTTARSTAQVRYRTTTVGSVVRRALAVTAAAGFVAVILAAALAGAPAVVGAVIGTLMVCLFFSAGAMVVNVVTTLAPNASLLVALLTYTLKVVLIGLVFLALSGSGALDGPVDGQWLGGTVIACTLVWLATQIFFSVRARQPLYDLPPETEEADVR